METTRNVKNRIKALYESVGRGFESLPSHQKNAVRSKDFMAFLFFATQLHGFCTVGARFVFSVLNYVGRGIALQSVPFFAFRSTVQLSLIHI